MTQRPPFIVAASDVPKHAHVYPQSTEQMGPIRGASDGRRVLAAAIGIPRRVGPS